MIELKDLKMHVLAVPLAILSVIQATVNVIQALLSGRLRFVDLWPTIMTLIKNPPLKFDREVQADSIAEYEKENVVQTNGASREVEAAKPSDLVAALCRAIVKKDVDLVAR